MVLGKTATRNHLISKASVPPVDLSSFAKTSKDILAAADKAEPKIRRAMLDALDALQSSVPDLEALIASGDTSAVIGAVTGLQLPDDLFLAIREATLNAAIAVATPEAASFNIAFNNVNERAVRWASANAANLVTGQVDQTLIRQMVVNATERGIHPSVTAREIREIVPLTRRHGIAVERLRDSMREAGIVETHIERVAGRKARKLLRWRANMIARTEAINSANSGQQIVWNTAQDLGLIPQGTRKVWVATPDSRTCPICSVLDGTTVEISAEFQVNRQATSFTRQGSEFTVAGTKPLKNPRVTKVPTAHPACRCSVILEPL